MAVSYNSRGLPLESAVLYTFSTIPQTLGAAFAVLAAFVIYRFQADVGTRTSNARMLLMRRARG